jgi:hypothetical protein
MATANSGFKIAQVKKKGKEKEKVARTQKTLVLRAFKRGEDRLNNKSIYDIDNVSSQSTYPHKASPWNSKRNVTVV